MKKPIVRTIALLILSIAVLGGCFLPGHVRLLINWKNYDFDDGLGRPFSAALRDIVGTPIEGGAAIVEFGVNGTGQEKTIWGVSTALVRSDDAGQGWKILEDTMLSPFGGPYRIGFDQNGSIWIATRGMLFRSDDDGATWSIAYPGPPGIQCIGISDMAIAGSTIWLVTDAGTLVRVLQNPIRFSEVYSTSIPIFDVMCATSGALYICTSQRILVSTNEETTFSAFAEVPGANDLVEVSGTMYCCAGGQVVQIGMDGAVLSTFAPPSSLMYRSLCSSGNYVFALCADWSGNFLVRIDAQNGNTTSDIQIGGESTGGDVYSDSDGVIYVGVSGRVLISYTAGDTWEEHPFGLSTVNSIALKEGQVWAGLDGSGAAVFQPGTSTWETVGTRLERALSSHVTAVQMYPPSRVVLAGSPGQEVAISENGGDDFHFVWAAPDDGVQFHVQNFAENSQGSLYMLVSCGDLAISAFSARIYRSDDQGESWCFVSSFCDEQNGGCSGTLVIDERRACMWAAIGPYDAKDGSLFKGDANGDNWTRLSDMGIDMASLAVMDKFDNLYVVGNGSNGIGIYRLDVGDSWSFEPTPHSEEYYYPNSFTVDADGGYWLGTNFGLYYRAMGSGWTHMTKQDGLASDIVRAVKTDGEGSGMVVWVGTALGASCGTFEQ